MTAATYTEVFLLETINRLNTEEFFNAFVMAVSHCNTLLKIWLWTKSKSEFLNPVKSCFFFADVCKVENKLNNILQAL
jgi:hypothetical protein